MTKNILIIDDDQNLVRMSKDALERGGMFVEVAYNGKEGIDMLRVAQKPYDLVILEVLVPKLNGVDVCEEMQRDSALSDVPVLLTSILPLSSGAFQRSLKLHHMFNLVRDTLEKPYDMLLLTSKVQKLLECINH